MTQNPETPITIERLQGLLSDWFAPWIQAMGLRVESFADGEDGSLPAFYVSVFRAAGDELVLLMQGRDERPV